MIRATLVCLLLVALVSGDWEIVQNNYATVAVGTSFTGPESGYIAGATGSLNPLLLLTSDGGVTLDNQGLVNKTTGAFLSIRMGSSTWGVAGGLGFFGLPCGAYTNDGSTWNVMEQETYFFFCAFQGAATVDDEKTGVLVGGFSDNGDWNGNGIKITTDGGQNWAQYNAPTTIPCRYASFLSKDMGYVSGGTFPTTPEEDSAIELRTRYPVNSRFSYDLVDKTFHYRERIESQSVYSGYAASISAVTNEGKDWKLLFNETNSGFYFNEISCSDTKNCWAVTDGREGFNNTGKIFHTSDGWSSYDVQLTLSGGSFTCIDMTSATTGWAAGALVEGDISGEFEGVFYQTTDGVTWTPTNQLRNFFPQDISVGGPNNVYATGISPAGLSSFASYSS